MEHHDLIGHEGDVTCLAVSPSGALVASGGRDGSVRVWHPATGKSVHVLDGHTRPVNAVQFVSESMVVSASADTTLRVWSLADGSAQVLGGHEQIVTGVAVVPGHRIVSASADGTLRRWRLDDGTCEAVFGTVLDPDSDTDWVNEVHLLAVAADGRLAITDGGGGAYLRLWDLPKGGDVGIPGRYLPEPRHWCLGGSVLVRPDAGGGVSLFGLPDRDLRASLPGWGPGVLAVDGARLWAVDADGVLSTLDLGSLAVSHHPGLLPFAAVLAVTQTEAGPCAAGRGRDGQLLVAWPDLGHGVALAPLAARTPVVATRGSEACLLAVDGARVRCWRLDEVLATTAVSA